jgi:hypothetical protein
LEKPAEPQGGISPLHDFMLRSEAKPSLERPAWRTTRM